VPKADISAGFLDLPAHLKDELQQLADEHNCDFKDWLEHRFVQFVSVETLAKA
jgi:hypothetical protein